MVIVIEIRMFVGSIERTFVLVNFPFVHALLKSGDIHSIMSSFVYNYFSQSGVYLVKTKTHFS